MAQRDGLLVQDQQPGLGEPVQGPLRRLGVGQPLHQAGAVDPLGGVHAPVVHPDQSGQHPAKGTAARLVQLVVGVVGGAGDRLGDPAGGPQTGHGQPGAVALPPDGPQGVGEHRQRARLRAGELGGAQFV